jgi:hypothetical protein
VPNPETFSSVPPDTGIEGERCASFEAASVLAGVIETTAATYKAERVLLGKQNDLGKTSTNRPAARNANKFIPPTFVIKSSGFPKRRMDAIVSQN